MFQVKQLHIQSGQIVVIDGCINSRLPGFFGRRREARERQATKPDKHGVRTQNELVCGPPTFFGGLRDSRNPILQSSRKPLCRNALLLVIVGLSQVGCSRLLWENRQPLSPGLV